MTPDERRSEVCPGSGKPTPQDWRWLVNRSGNKRFLCASCLRFFTRAKTGLIRKHAAPAQRQGDNQCMTR